MGAPKGGGYEQKEVLNSSQRSLLQQLLGLSGQNLGAGGNLSQNPLYQQSVEATRQFLPGGQGFAPIQAEAQRNFQQQTIPSILNAFGSGAKSSSALNQALAGAGQNLNTSLASQLAQMQLGAAHQGAGLAQLPFQQGLSAAGLGLGTSPFAYLQRAAPFWQDLLLAGISGGSKIGSAALGGVR
jgi:hypothetical protein